MINRRDAYSIILNAIGVLLGLIALVMLKNVTYHIFYIVAISCILVLSVIVGESGWIRPYSYLILSFFVFVWMRYILNILFDSPIISVGSRITTQNTNLVSIYLGLSVNVICITATIFWGIMRIHSEKFYLSSSGIRFSKYVENLIIIMALSFFAMFLIDSVRKINIIQMHDYLNVSETVLVSGYIWFSLGKWVLLIWIIFGKDEHRFFKGSTIIAIAGMGFLMRGARGYAIMYMFLWLLFYSQKRKIRIIPLALLGIALLYLANFILSYRLGWSVASGFVNIIQSVLHQQGASVEPVFGSVIFRSEILPQFSFFDLITRNDFGVVVDRARGVNWESGGFGSSFFAEAFYLGFPLCLIILIIVGICVGFVECAYQVSRISKVNQGEKGLERNISTNTAEFANIILFMTIPNLVYLGRSSIKDFIIKTFLVAVILLTLRSVKIK